MGNKNDKPKVIIKNIFTELIILQELPPKLFEKVDKLFKKIDIDDSKTIDREETLKQLSRATLTTILVFEFR